MKVTKRKERSRSTYGPDKKTTPADVQVVDECFFGRDENRPRDTWGSCERLRKDGMCPGVIIVRR